MRMQRVPAPRPQLGPWGDLVGSGGSGYRPRDCVGGDAMSSEGLQTLFIIFAYFLGLVMGGIKPCSRPHSERRVGEADRRKK